MKPVKSVLSLAVLGTAIVLPAILSSAKPPKDEGDEPLFTATFSFDAQATIGNMTPIVRPDRIIVGIGGNQGTITFPTNPTEGVDNIGDALVELNKTLDVDGDGNPDPGRLFDDSAIGRDEGGNPLSVTLTSDSLSVYAGKDGGTPFFAFYWDGTEQPKPARYELLVWGEPNQAGQTNFPYDSTIVLDKRFRISRWGTGKELRGTIWDSDVNGGSAHVEVFTKQQQAPQP